MYDEVKSTGQPHTTFSTGSRRDNRVGKGRYDLVSPISMLRLAKHMENGARKYSDRNWEKGQPLSTYWDSAVRHLFMHLEGRRDEDHLAAAMWNVHGMIHTEEMIRRGLLPKELDDLPCYVKKDDSTAEAWTLLYRISREADDFNKATQPVGAKKPEPVRMWRSRVYLGIQWKLEDGKMYVIDRESKGDRWGPSACTIEDMRNDSVEEIVDPVKLCEFDVTPPAGPSASSAAPSPDPQSTCVPARGRYPNLNVPRPIQDQSPPPPAPQQPKPVDPGVGRTCARCWSSSYCGTHGVCDITGSRLYGRGT